MFKDTMFYIGWFALSAIPFAIILFCPLSVKTKIIACICALAITLVLMILIVKNDERQSVSWNNGFCSCGGTYKLSEVTQYRYQKTFYYTCNKCGHTEMFSKIMD